MIIYLPITTLYTFVFLNALFIPFTCILKLTIKPYVITLQRRCWEISMSFIFRCNPSQMFYRVGAHVTESLFNRVAMLIPATLLKERFRHYRFSCEFCAIFKNAFYRIPLGGCFCILYKDFVILQVLANFNKSSFIFPLLSLLLCNPSFVILASL